MIKSIFKEIFIMILICIAIVLVMGVIFYSYIPTNKIVPEKISYKAPENIKNELQETILNETQEVIVKYDVDASDLNKYSKSGDYVKGKANPFELDDTNTNFTGNTTNGTNSSNTNSNKTNSGSSGTFYNEAGTK